MGKWQAEAIQIESFVRTANLWFHNFRFEIQLNKMEEEIETIKGKYEAINE